MTRQKKSLRLEPLTLMELRPIIEDYHHDFPSWHVLDRTLIARESGPLLQYIGFERLSGGAYRVQCGIYFLCVPDREGGFPPQYLSVKRSIYPQAHEAVRDKVVSAIHREIIPSIDAPLDVEQVIATYQNQEMVRSPDARNLAALNAYLGNDDRALYWCDRFYELVEQLGLGWQEWDMKRQAFLHSLRQWISAGAAKQQLERVVQEERRKWGLV